MKELLESTPNSLLSLCLNREEVNHAEPFSHLGADKNLINRLHINLI